MTRFNVISILIGSCLMLAYTQKQPVINIEKVKSDMIKAEGHNVPVNIIKNRKSGMFTIMYTDDACFVYLSYRDYASEPQMKSSLMTVYSLDKNRWKLEAVVPYYYDVKLLDANSKVFLSDNLFCEPKGDCVSYTEINTYQVNDFQSLVSYSGFDKVPYYETLLASSEKESIIKALGDTIKNMFRISDISVREGAGLSFDLNQEIGILKSMDNDSLHIQWTTKSTRVTTFSKKNK